MENNTDLRKVVYSIMLTQIQFGTYRCGEKLPTIEETSRRLCVSIDTARTAYLKLKDEGYITLSKNVGATVKVNYDSQETEQFIQTFFSARKNAMIDLINSMLPLFGNAQCVGMKNASPEMLRKMEELFTEKNIEAPYAMLRHLNQKYSSLGNNLLMRLAWQIFMFLHDPFFSIKDNLHYFDQSEDYLSIVLVLCRKKEWTALRVKMAESMNKLTSSLTRFYKDRIHMPSPEKEVAFTWSSYKKSQQLCYSIAMEVLISINRGLYPAGSLLPSQEELARQKNVSVSTIRRTLELLGSVGAIKSARHVGTRVLPLEQTSANSDFTKPVLRRRLLDMAESIQMLALSCKDVSVLTLSSLNTESIEELCVKLKAYKGLRRGENLSYFILSTVGESAPYQTIRTVYSELMRQFFWGYAFRGMNGKQEQINEMYDPFFDELIESLEKMDFCRFSASLEELAVLELRRTLSFLLHLGISDAESILIPE